jgi:mitochondrial fission protein ELM1
MISEAAGSKKYVFVFNKCGLGRRHKRFLEFLTQNNYIYPVDAEALAEAIDRVWGNKPQIHSLNDAGRVKEAVGLII